MIKNTFKLSLVFGIISTLLVLIIFHIFIGNRAGWAASPICPGVDFFHTRLNTHTYSRHWHEEFAIGLVHEGCGVNKVDRRSIAYPSQSIILINPRQVHTGFSAGQLDLHYSMFYILPDFMVKGEGGQICG